MSTKDQPGRFRGRALYPAGTRIAGTTIFRWSLRGFAVGTHVGRFTQMTSGQTFTGSLALDPLIGCNDGIASPTQTVPIIRNGKNDT